jgi:hypothetical protein
MVARRNTNIRAASPLQDCCEPQISISFAQQKLTSSMARCWLYLQTTSGVLVWVRLSLSGASKLGKKKWFEGCPGFESRPVGFSVVIFARMARPDH